MKGLDVFDVNWTAIHKRRGKQARRRLATDRSYFIALNFVIKRLRWKKFWNPQKIQSANRRPDIPGSLRHYNHLRRLHCREPSTKIKIENYDLLLNSDLKKNCFQIQFYGKCQIIDPAWKGRKVFQLIVPPQTRLLWNSCYLKEVSITFMLLFSWSSLKHSS
jgi:hypothetical protein